MLLMDDMQLLEEYTARQSEAAFSTLVSRHINLVYSAAFRQVGNRQEAEEVTQAVFALLAAKARGFIDDGLRGIEAAVFVTWQRGDAPRS